MNFGVTCGLFRWEPKYLRIRWTDFTIFAPYMVGIELQMINQTFFFQHLKGRAMATNFVANRYLSVCINSINDTSILYENFPKIGPVYPEIFD